MSVRLERHGDHVVELVMDRPEAMNALSTQQAKELIAAADELAADRGVRAVVLSSALPKAFCVGADLKERNSFSDSDLEDQRGIFRRCFGGLMQLPMPTIAAVEGFALGGGFELALCCDLILASETAVFGLPEIGVGVIPGGGGTQNLSRRVGLARAADVIFTGRRVSVDEGLDWGFVARRVSAGEAAAEAVALAEVVAGKSPVGARAAKRALHTGFDLPLGQGLDLEHEGWQDTAFSADRREGIAAFNEKRTPNWPG
ncbi:enoyl-CoA hydratase [Enemella dayhoffiae]|uniref:enoyl-CoA hydratase n=1 Tax=Enemella dayhoffiae TaxID=2016507 RepID=A0A255GYR3_9ACTN|nr:enoyl-CoA hydratase-related protein [Enemella dayhoffiae]OYO20805.1 enoyl-CoA hydratase [Enemella dayhoffiae]